MAQYKVPQDVEADDKLIGPFSFRQFVYLLIAGGLVALAVALFQLFPLLAIIPLPFIAFFLILALPIKKDQPMETYLAAIVTYYLKPHKRIWTPGQRESTILITAPKIVEDVRTRDISGEEATHRLSFLADLVDTQGYAIKGASNSSMREDLVAEANATMDMFDNYKSVSLERAINEERQERHKEVIQEMKEAISRREEIDTRGAKIQNDRGMVREREPVSGQEVVSKPQSEVLMDAKSGWNSPVIVMPGPMPEQKTSEKTSQIPPKPSIIELANNSDFTVATIAKEANRINRKEEGEVFISLH